MRVLDPRWLTIVPACGLLALAVVGAVELLSADAPRTDPATTANTECALERSAPEPRNDTPEMIAKDVAQAREDALRQELESERKSAATLRGRLEDVLNEKQELASRVATLEGGRTVTLDGIMTKIRALERTEFDTFLKPGVVADLTADLKTLGEDGLKALRAMLASEDEKDRLLAAQLLISMNDPASIEPLKEAALADEDEFVASMASQALIRMDDRAVVPALKDLVANTKYEGVKVNCLWGLCKQGDVAGTEEALAYFKDKKNSSDMRYALGAGIFLLADARLMTFADTVVADCNNHERVLGLAVRYYRNVGNTAARLRLERFTRDENVPQSVRSAAEQALANL